MNNKRLSLLIAIAYVLVFLFIQVLAEEGALGVESLIQHKPVTQLDPVGTIITAVIFTLATIALFTWMKWATISRDFLLTRPWSLLFWCLIAALGAIIPSTFLQEQMPEWSDAIQKYIEQTAQQMVGIMNTPGGYAVICLLAPIAEELVFRGAVLKKLLEWKPERRWLMITLSALLFALATAASLPHRLAAGMDVRTYWQHPARHHLSLGQQYGGLPVDTYLSGS